MKSRYVIQWIVINFLEKYVYYFCNYYFPIISKIAESIRDKFLLDTIRMLDPYNKLNRLSDSSFLLCFSFIFLGAFRKNLIIYN